MRAPYSLLLLAAFTLVGCERLTGAEAKKTHDAEAIGYACRVSLKAPEDCMQENATHSPTALLNGWKEADKDISNQVLDPSMGKKADIPAAAPVAPPAANEPPNKVSAEKSSKEKPTPAKPGKGEAEKKTSH